MIYTLFVLALISAIFTTISHDTRKKSFSNFVMIIFTLIFAPLLFLLFKWYNYSILLLIIAGLLLVYFSFVHLGILNKTSILHEFYIQLFLMVVFSATLHLDWSVAVWGPISYIIFYAILNLGIIRLKPAFQKNSDIANQGFELLRTLNGIYLMIFGLTLATNRIGFLAKLIHMLFI